MADLSAWKLFSAGDVAQILRIPRRRVLLYVEQGVVEPEVDSPGRGHRRKFNLSQLLEIAVASKFDALGIAPRHLAYLMAVFRVIPFAVKREEEKSRTQTPEYNSFADRVFEWADFYDFLVVSRKQGAEERTYKLSTVHLGLQDYEPERPFTMEQAEMARKLVMDLEAHSVAGIIALSAMVRETFERAEEHMRKGK